MNEKQLLDRLKREADTVPLPETLSPEAIERMLLAAQKNQAVQSKNSTEPSANTQESDDARCTFFAASTGSISDAPASAQSAASSDTDSSHRKGGSNMKKHTSFYHCAMRYGSLAAVFVLGVTVLWQANQISSLKENQAALPPENGKASVVTETEVSETDHQNADTDTARDTDSEKAAIVDTNQSGQSVAEASNHVNVSKSSAAASASSNDAFTYADSYEQIYNTLKDKLGLALYARDSAYDVYAESASDTGVSTASSADTAASSDVQNTSDFSETNLQEAGVDE